jgi:hypothetical protein
MEVNNATKEIAIRSIEKLTDEMLTAEVSAGITLTGFLTTGCTVLSEGEFKVYSTSNCTHFKRLKENRMINEAHVLALIDSFLNDGYLFTILYLNEKLEIIDGQHRLEAAKRKSLPVYFMIMPGWSIKEVTILNMNSRNWTIVDFMETHAKAGNPNYVRFKEFFDAYEFDVTVCQLIITGRRSGGYASSDEFRMGYMQVDEQQLTDAYLKAKKIMCLIPFHPHGWKSRNFVEAMLLFFSMKGYDHEHMIAKLTTYPDLMLREAKSLRVEEYVKILLEKYNFRRQKDKIEVTKR